MCNFLERFCNNLSNEEDSGSRHDTHLGDDLANVCRNEEEYHGSAEATVEEFDNEDQNITNQVK